MMAGMHPWTGLSDDVRLGVLTEWVTAGLVDEVLAECGRRDQKPGALPARFMVYFVLALALFQPDSYDDVAENLVGALEGMDEAIPAKSSFTRARQRLGAGVIEAVFRRLAGPVAPPGLDGAFWRGMRVAAVDGFTLDVPDTPANRAASGGPVGAKGQPAEHRLDPPRAQPLPGPGERGPVRDRLIHPLQRPHQVLRDIVIGVLLEQGKSEHVVDHEPGRKRPGFLVPLAALSQDLIHQIGGHPLGEHTQPHVIS